MMRRRATLPVHRGLLAALFAVLLLSPPAQAQSELGSTESAAAKSATAELASAAAPQPITPNQARAVPPPSGAIDDLLSLIQQIEPLRVTVLYIDYHDQALAAQRKHQQMRRRAGIGRLTPGRMSYAASQGWANKQTSSGGRSEPGR